MTSPGHFRKKLKMTQNSERTTPIKSFAILSGWRETSFNIVTYR